jgi:hypothetical protein
MWFRRKTLDAHFNETKRVVVNGVIFKIKKINPMDHLQGMNCLQKIYNIYKTAKEKGTSTPDNEIETLKKIQNYCRDILLAGVVTPKLSAKADGTGYHVDQILADFKMTQELAGHILKFTYKKKLTIP